MERINQSTITFGGYYYEKVIAIVTLMLTTITLATGCSSPISEKQVITDLVTGDQIVIEYDSDGNITAKYHIDKVEMAHEDGVT